MKCKNMTIGDDMITWDYFSLGYFVLDLDTPN